MHDVNFAYDFRHIPILLRSMHAYVSYMYINTLVQNTHIGTYTWTLEHAYFAFRIEIRWKVRPSGIESGEQEAGTKQDSNIT